jgi:hypothetical protein
MEKVRYQDEQLKKKGTDYQRWLIRKKAVSYLQGLINVTDLEKEIRGLEESAGRKAELTRQDQEMQREMEMRQQYSQALKTENLDYWKRVTGMMGKVARNGTREDAWLNKRVLNFLSLSAYMNANAMLKAGALPDADRMVQIYALVDPPNSEHAYLRAILDMRAAHPEAALQSLSQAISLGFDDADRLEKDPEFAALHGKEGFTKSVQLARENRAK